MREIYGHNMHWELYYRGSFGRWADLLKKEGEEKIVSGLFKRYLDTKKKLSSLVEEMNRIEKDAESTYLLLNALPNGISDKDQAIFLNELIVYINSKEVK